MNRLVHMHAGAHLSKATPMCSHSNEGDLVVDEIERTTCVDCQLIYAERQDKQT